MTATGPVLLIGAGPIDGAVFELATAHAGPIVAADGGAAAALGLGRRPDLVIGDLDSLDPESAAALDDVEILHDRDQDTTDFEKCLARIDAPLTLALGVTGARIDHTLGAMSALAGPLAARTIILTEHDAVFAARADLTLDLPHGTRISLYPMGEVRGRSEGLEWPIDGLTLHPSGRVAISNRVTGPVRVEANGPLLVVLPVERLTAAMDAIWPERARSR